MPRVLSSYDPVDDPTQQTSTGTGNVVTFTAPASAAAAFITCETNACRITLNSSTPTTSVGIVIPKDTAPVFIPTGKTIKAISTVAGNSLINVLWLR